MGGFGWVECEDKAVDGRIELTGDTTAQPGQMVVVDLEKASAEEYNHAPIDRAVRMIGRESKN